MTTVKSKTKKDAEAWLEATPAAATSDPRTGVKSWEQRKRFHDMNAEIAPAAHAPIDTTDERAAAFALLKRAGINTDPASLDHAAVYQDINVQRAAVTVGGSVARYNARSALLTCMRSLPTAAQNRHTEQGGKAYRRIYASAIAAAKALEEKGGEKIKLPALLDSDFDKMYNV